MATCEIFISLILVTSFGCEDDFCKSPRPNSPNVGLAPQTINESSAEMTLEVKPHPMSVIFHPR